MKRLGIAVVSIACAASCAAEGMEPEPSSLPPVSLDSFDVLDTFSPAEPRDELSPLDPAEQIEIVAYGQHIAGLAVDAGSLYVVTPGNPGATPDTIRAIRTWTGSATILGHAIETGSMVTDASYVYFTDVERSAVMRARKVGGDPVVVAGTEVQPYAIAVHDGRLFWTTLAGELVTATDKGDARGVLVADAGMGLAIAANADYVAWFDAEAGEVKLAKISNPVPRAIAKVGGLDALAMDATHVYWIDRDAGAIVRASLASGATETVAVADGAAITSMALDSAAVFWTQSDGQVLRVTKTGGAPLQIAAEQSGPAHVALFEGYVYWANVDAGTVLRFER